MSTSIIVNEAKKQFIDLCIYTESGERGCYITQGDSGMLYYSKYKNIDIDKIIQIFKQIFKDVCDDASGTQITFEELFDAVEKFQRKRLHNKTQQFLYNIICGMRCLFGLCPDNNDQKLDHLKMDILKNWRNKIK